MSFDPQRALHDPGFTPGKAHLPALLELLSEVGDDEARQLERVIGRAGEVALQHVIERYERATPQEKVRLVRIAGEFSSEPAGALLVRALGSGDPLLQRWAARGLGRGAARTDVEQALLGALRDAALPLQRALVEALGKVGGAAAREYLEAASPSDDDLKRRRERALLLLKRRGERELPGRITLDTALPARFVLRARTRAGLAALASDELVNFELVTVTSPAAVEFRHEGTLADLFTSRIALDFGVVLRAPAHASGAQALAELLCEGPATRVLRAWSEGPLRYRLAYAGGGHRRAEVWKVAELVSARNPSLVNDSRAATWEFVVGEALDRDGVLLVPKAYADPRFAYRQADVPAASHPTLAAALSRVAGVRSDDVVWDPFVGSALELVERGLLGPYARLLGSDADPRALDAARSNLTAAGLARFELVQADALQYRPAGVTLILSNPPMGRRVARDGSLRPLLKRFVEHAASVLAPAGRLVWLSPLPELTARAASAAGLRLTQSTTVDMGGFSAELQAMTLEAGRNSGGSP